jgi:ribonucleotide monophosphatase NagD (HAD superfamily)
MSADPPIPAPPPTVTVDELLERHAVLLLDAYGVLLHHGGALAGAGAFVDRLNAGGRAYFILTNDASSLPESTAARFARMGLAIPAERIVTSGSLLTPFFAGRALAGSRCVVLGPEDSREYVRRAGGVIAGPGDGDASVLVLCDEVGFDFVSTIDETLTWLFQRFDAGLPVHLVLPNPDLVYPKSERGFGITAGSVARIFEGALAQRYPRRGGLVFARLGKPNRPIFEEAERRAGTRDLVMVGDQLGTDIRGALDFGIAAALALGGLDRHDPAGPVQPTYLLPPLGRQAGAPHAPGSG